MNYVSLCLSVLAVFMFMLSMKLEKRAKGSYRLEKIGFLMGNTAFVFAFVSLIIR